MNKNTYSENQKETMGENSFMKKLLKKRLNQKGLTLIELLAVIVILAIVAAIAVPAIGNVIENSRYNAVKADAVNVLSAANIYFTENPDKAWVSTSILKNEGFLQDPGKIPTATTPASTEPADTTTTDAKVKKIAAGNTLYIKDVKYSGDKKVTFDAATSNIINNDTQKGSDAGDKKVPK